MARNPNKSKSWRARSSVFIVTVDESFKAISPWTLPEVFTAPVLHIRRAFLDDARAFVREFNKRAVQGFAQRNNTPWDRQWALIVACCRRNHIRQADGMSEIRTEAAKDGAA